MCGLALVFLFALNTLTLPHPLAILRVMLGLLFTLFIPGYYICLALLPRIETTDLSERFALSIGLSCVQLPIIALILNLTGRGVSLNTVMLSEAIVIIFFGGLAYLRRAGSTVSHTADSRELPAQSEKSRVSRSNRLVMGVLALSLFATFVALIGLASTTPTVTEFTEFYLLGQDAQARQYPHSTVVGEPVTITVGVRNQEGTPTTYSIEVRDGGTLIGQHEPITLNVGEQQEFEVTFTPTIAGETRSIDFLLLRGEDSAVYRRLELLMRVNPASSEEV
jgi:uncharacterized membrane protein